MIEKKSTIYSCKMNGSIYMKEVYKYSGIILPPLVYAEMDQVVRLILSAFLNFNIMNSCIHLLDNEIGVPNG